MKSSEVSSISLIQNPTHVSTPELGRYSYRRSPGDRFFLFGRIKECLTCEACPSRHAKGSQAPADGVSSPVRSRYCPQHRKTCFKLRPLCFAPRQDRRLVLALNCPVRTSTGPKSHASFFSAQL